MADEQRFAGEVLYSRQSAAEYWGFTLENLAYYIRREKLSYLPKIGRGGGCLLAKSELDRFKELHDSGALASRARRVEGAYSVPEAAKYIGVSRTAIYNYIARKKIIPMERKTPSESYIFTESELIRFKNELSKRLQRRFENAVKKAEKLKAVKAAKKENLNS